ncbi:MAG: hypothetical protein AB7T49_15090 [Oligoflexales bacterium]
MTDLRKISLIVFPWLIAGCFTTSDKVVEQSHSTRPRWVEEKHLSAFKQRTDFFLVYHAGKQPVLDLAVKQAQIDAISAMQSALERYVNGELAKITAKTSPAFFAQEELDAIVALESREHTKEYTLIHDIFYEKIEVDPEGSQSDNPYRYNVYALARIPEESLQKFYEGLASKLKSNKNHDLSNLGKILISQVRPGA